MKCEIMLKSGAKLGFSLKKQNRQLLFPTFAKNF